MSINARSYCFACALGLGAGCASAQSKKYPDPPQVTPSAQYRVKHTVVDWKAMLTPEQYNDPPAERHGIRFFESKYDHFYQKGTYYSAASLQPVRSSEAKFNSGTGWPSFYAPIQPGRGAPGAGQ